MDPEQASILPYTLWERQQAVGLWVQQNKRLQCISTTWRRRERHRVIEKTPKHSFGP